MEIALTLGETETVWILFAGCMPGLYNDISYQLRWDLLSCPSSSRFVPKTALCSWARNRNAYWRVLSGPRLGVFRIDSTRSCAVMVHYMYLPSTARSFLRFPVSMRNEPLIALSRGSS